MSSHGKTDADSGDMQLSAHCHICRFLLKVVGLGFPLFHGTGLLFSPVGVLPYQSPIRIVVGKPIEVPHIQDVYSEEGKRQASSLCSCRKYPFDCQRVQADASVSSNPMPQMVKSH